MTLKCTFSQQLWSTAWLAAAALTEANEIELYCTVIPDKVDHPLPRCRANWLIVNHDDLVPWDELALWWTSCQCTKAQSFQTVFALTALMNNSLFIRNWCNLTTFSSFLFSLCSLQLKIHTSQQELQHTAGILYLAWLSEPPPVSRCLQQIRSQALGPVSSPPFGELVAQTCPRPDGPPPGSCSGRRDCWWRGAVWSGHVFWSFCWAWCDSKPNMSVIITVV